MKYVDHITQGLKRDEGYSHREQNIEASGLCGHTEPSQQTGYGGGEHVHIFKIDKKPHVADDGRCYRKDAQPSLGILLQTAAPRSVYRKPRQISHQRHSNEQQEIFGVPCPVKDIARGQQPYPSYFFGKKIIYQQNRQEKYDELNRIEQHPGTPFFKFQDMKHYSMRFMRLQGILIGSRLRAGSLLSSGAGLLWFSAQCAGAGIPQMRREK